MTQPAVKGEREPGFSTNLSISIPAIPDAYRGTAFDYTFTLTNVSTHSVTLKPSTVYRQLVFNGAVTSVTTATLPVGSGRLLAPNATATFRMHVPAPGDPGPSYHIDCYFADGTGGGADQI